MADIREDYASPMLRWALCLEDHPDAQRDFRIGKAAEFDVPPHLADQDVVICTITWVEHGVTVEHRAFKDLMWKQSGGSRRLNVADVDLEKWVVLQTKALGRTLKAAGYPDDMPSLKAVVLWRQRRAEVALIGAAPVPLELGRSLPEPDTRALEAAAVRDPEHVDGDEDDEPFSDVPVGAASDPANADGEPIDAEVMADDDQMTEVRKAIGALGRRQAEVAEWAKAQGIPWPPQGLTEKQAAAVLERCRSLTAEAA